jgi:hypothetical protein
MVQKAGSYSVAVPHDFRNFHPAVRWPISKHISELFQTKDEKVEYISFPSFGKFHPVETTPVMLTNLFFNQNPSGRQEFAGFILFLCTYLISKRKPASINAI